MMMEAVKWHNRYFLLSWKLWKHLLYPQENAVFKRAITQNHQQKLTLYHLWLMIVGGSVLSYGIISYLQPLSIEFPIMALIVLVIFSSIITVVWLVAITVNILHEYQQATYDLICVTPTGKMGASWSIVTGILHRQDLFRWVEFGRRWFSGLVLLVLVCVLLLVILTTLGDSRYPSPEDMLLSLDVLAFIILTYVEYVQTVLQGVLIAVLTPRTTGRAANVVVWAVSVFITLQVVMMVVSLIGSMFFQFVFKSSHWQYASILPQLLLFFVMREGCIYGLWKLLSHQIDAKTYDLNHI